MSWKCEVDVKGSVNWMSREVETGRHEERLWEAESVYLRKM